VYAEINYNGQNKSVLLGQVCSTVQHGHSEGSGKCIQQCCCSSQWGSITRLGQTAGVTSGSTSAFSDWRLQCIHHMFEAMSKVVDFISCCCWCYCCETALIMLLLLLLQSPCMQLAAGDCSTCPNLRPLVLLQHWSLLV